MVMNLTNTIMLAAELKKLIGDRCHTEIFSEDNITVNVAADSAGHSGCIDILIVPKHREFSGCCVTIEVDYAIKQKLVAEITTKLKDGDSINVRDGGMSVHRVYKIKVGDLDNFSTSKIESTAKKIVDIMQSL